MICVTPVLFIMHRAVDDVLECVKDVLELHCNSEIAEWQKTVDTKMLGPILDQIDCGTGIVVYGL